MRFVIVFLPYMYMVVSYGIFKSSKIARKKKLVYPIIAIIGVIWLVSSINQAAVPNYREYPEFSDYLKKDDIREGIWVSNPAFMVESDRKADELVYYPLYSSRKIDALKKRVSEAEHILIDTCDLLPCPPSDKECKGKTAEFFGVLKKDFKLYYHGKENGCEKFIFRR